jgi:redox-sensitive bicupin YhaK (pirin superfamily)
MFLHQNAAFSIGDITNGNKVAYNIKYNGNGVYVFVISGRVKIGNETLETRDGMGITEAQSFEVESMEDARVLLIDVPMEW